MKKLTSNFKNIFLVLTGIILLAVISSSVVHSLVKDKIQQSKEEKLLGAVRKVLPPYDHFDAKPTEMNDGVEIMKIYKAYDKQNRFVGAAVESSSNNGYIGHIDVMVGFDKSGQIVDYVVTEQKETPGLGARILDWFKTNHKNQSIIGKNASTANLSVRNDGGDIDAITGATITSRAFLFAVRNAYFAFTSNTGQVASAVNLKADSIQNPTNH